MAVKKANAILGMIKRNIQFKSKDNMVRLYKSLVRPRLEYCIQAWNPYLKKDIDMLERVQKRAAKMVERFDKFNLRKKNFTQRVINSWNSLPLDVVEADTINSFKNRLDRFDGYFMPVSV